MSLSASTLEPFVTADEIRAALAQPDLSDEQADWLAEVGSAAIRAEVGQMVNVVDGDEVLLDGTGSGLILLPELAVRDVSLVAVGGVELTPDVDYEWTAAGCLWHAGSRRIGGWSALGRWPRKTRAVRVVYDHGWAPPSPQWDAARGISLEVASRTFRNPEMLQSERIGDWSRAWVPTGGRAALTDIERRSLDILRPGR